jgi:hypothetical protein
MVRKPVVAGMFYEDNDTLLNKEIENCFLDKKFGPGALPSGIRDKKIIGVIAPHAGYSYSGAGQAWCYKEIGESEVPDVYIIIGTAHMGFETAALTLEDFETPFGVVKNDNEFCEFLISKNAAINGKYHHIREHSIEVQLPFLQFVNKDRLNEVKIVPIVAGEQTDYEKLGKAIADGAKKLNKKIMLIASSDFTHYGISYGYLPFRTDVKKNLEKLDKGAINWIEKMNAFEFIDHVEKRGMTVCGAYAIAAVISACKELGAKKVSLLNYYASGDVSNDWSNAVGYASIILE